MGYAHYWEINKPKQRSKAFKDLEKRYLKAIKACTRLAIVYNKLADADHRLSGYSAHTSKYGGLKINGSRDYMHEDFTLREDLKDENGGFCKTSKKPYDEVVVACLLICTHYMPEFRVFSDGNSADWLRGQEIAARFLKRRIVIPPSIRSAHPLPKIDDSVWELVKNQVREDLKNEDVD